MSTIMNTGILEGNERVSIPVIMTYIQYAVNPCDCRFEGILIQALSLDFNEPRLSLMIRCPKT